MKKLITIVLIMFAVQVMAQDSEYLKLWNKYHDECSVIVSDTVIEEGTVTYDINPVNGDLKLIPVDTAWNVFPCPEYKEYSSYYDASSIIWGQNHDYFTLTGSLTLCDAIGYSYISKSENEKFTTSIIREKVCRLKLRKPTKEGYWAWLKENGYRK